MGKVFSFFSKKRIIYLIAVIVVAGVLFTLLGNSNGKQTVAVTKLDIVQEVAATGKVKPNLEVSLGFDKSGRVGRVLVSVGQEVKAGQTLAVLESGEVSADLAKAQAALYEEKIKLDEIKSTAPASYGDAYKNLDAAIKEGFADADNAVRNRVDQFFKDVPQNPRFEVSITSGNFIHYFNVPSDKAIEINSGRKNAENILNEWQKRISSLNPSDSVSEADKSISDLNQISAFLDKMASAVNSFSSADYAYDTTVSNYKTAISSARSEVSGAISAIVTAKDKINAAPILGEGGQFQSVLTQEAKVSQAEAVVSSLMATLGKSYIRAPFDGVVTVQDAKPGAAVTGGSSLISLISREQMYIEANISEINIGKVNAGNPVTVTFDAFPGEEFSGEVSYVEPGDFIIDGIVNYKIRVNLQNPDGKIKSGLTANLQIETSKKGNVVAVPLYAIEEENGQNFAYKKSGGESFRVPVTLGISGSNGMAEVLSGLEEGDIVEF